jgi:hypothetical protein
MGTMSGSTNEGSTLDGLLEVLLPLALAVAVVLAAGAWLAAWLAGKRLPFDPTAALTALWHFHDPALAWPKRLRNEVPSPDLYWSVSGVVLTVCLFLVVTLAVLWERHRHRPPDQGASSRGSQRPLSDKEIARQLAPQGGRKRRWFSL